MTATEQIVPGHDFQYYRDKYWNDFTIVIEMLNERATGSAETSWMVHLRDTYGPFRHALVLNCGNGWVERELVALGVVGSALGVDVSTGLLDQARDAAAEHDLPLRYAELDTNLAEFPDEGFDLVVNHAAMHHVAYIDRVTRKICELLPPDGVFVSWDYVGPHRNQYSARQWEAAWQVNQELPPEVRQSMSYPHLPTMIAGDPTEAVHSELILPTLDRYFTIDHRREVGGGIAYLLLTHNQSLHAMSPDESAPHVRTVMAADAELTAADPSTTLFAYVVSRPDKEVLADAARLDEWTAEEDERERRAAAADGIYYPRTAIAALAESLAGVGVPHDAVDAITPDAVLAHTSGKVLLRVLAARAKARLRLLERSISSRIPSRRSPGATG